MRHFIESNGSKEKLAGKIVLNNDVHLTHKIKYLEINIVILYILLYTIDWKYLNKLTFFYKYNDFIENNDIYLWTRCVCHLLAHL